MHVAMNKKSKSYGRSVWRQELNESKIDMGILDPFSVEALETSLYMSVMEDDHKSVRNLVRRGASPELWMAGASTYPAGTLLHYVARHGSVHMVTALLYGGADPVAKDKDGKTPRDVVPDAADGRRKKTILKQWEGCKPSTPEEDEEAVGCDNLIRRTGT